MGRKTALSALMLLLAACGDDDTKTDAGSNGGNEDAGDNGGNTNGGGNAGACAELDDLPEVPDNGIAYPDSHCGDDKCEVGGCDPLGRCSPACNAWQLKATVSFQAVECSEELDLGFPKPATRAGEEDLCTGTTYMISNPDAEVNCCQRADNLKADMPMLKLTGLQMTRPQTFSAAPVSAANQKALETDWYNSVIVLDSVENGERTVSVGTALPNSDGSFFPLAGEFESAGVTFNSDGKWDIQADVPAQLSDDGEGRLLKVGPTAADRDLILIVWGNGDLDYTQLELPVRGVEYNLPVTEDLSCVGERRYGSFAQVGTLTGFLPVDSLRDTYLYFGKGADGTNMCTFASRASSCSKDVSKWKPAN